MPVLALAALAVAALLWGVSVTVSPLARAIAGQSTGANYEVPAAAAPYLGLFDAAAARYGVPRDLLIRVAQQESHFDPDAHNEGSDASGMMQLVPRWYPGIDPFDPAQAIPAAARSLRQYHDQFDSWALALAAYNWGPGNLSDALASNAPLESWPGQTQDYVVDITGDTGIV